MFASHCLKVLRSSRHFAHTRTRGPALSHKYPSIDIIRQQSSGSNQTEVEMEHLEKNPYFTKYAERFKTLSETSPEQFQAKLDALEAAKQVEKKQREEDKSSAAAASLNHAKSLDSILKLDLIADKSTDEIAELWKQYHETRDSIFAVIPANEYLEMQRKAGEFTNFIYPVPRNEGYEYFLQRWSGDLCHFTSLLSFQTYRDLAPSCLTLIHYTELMDERGIVLMHGQPDVKTVSIYESQLLALQVKMYYGVCAGLKFNLVRHFNNAPDSFRHEQLIREFENYKKDARDKKAGMV